MSPCRGSFVGSYGGVGILSNATLGAHEGSSSLRRIPMPARSGGASLGQVSLSLPLVPMGLDCQRCIERLANLESWRLGRLGGLESWRSDVEVVFDTGWIRYRFNPSLV